MSRRAAVAATTSLLALVALAAPAQAATRPAQCTATLKADALVTTTVVPMSSAQLVGRTTAATGVRVDARAADSTGARVYHLAPGTVLEVAVAQGLETVSTTALSSGGWVRAADVTTSRSFVRCAGRLA